MANLNLKGKLLYFDEKYARHYVCFKCAVRLILKENIDIKIEVDTTDDISFCMEPGCCNDL